MRRLDVYLTVVEIHEARRAVDRAANTPVIVVGGVDASAEAWKHAKKLVHQYALAHGLSEITGYYGADLQTGELLAP